MKPWTRAADYCKKWEAEQERQGRRPVKFATVADTKSAAARMCEDETLARLIDGSRKQVQVCVDYTHDETGITITLKCLIDLVPDSRGEWGPSLVDLKSTCDASYRAWRKKVSEYGYDLQGALYLDAFNAVSGSHRCEFRHLIQESDWPYEVVSWPLSIESVNIGRGRYLDALDDYCRCLAEKNWPGYHRQSRWGYVEPTKYAIENYPSAEPDSRMREYQSVEAV